MINVLYIGEDEYWAGILTEALKGLAEVTTTPTTDEVVEGQVDLIVLDALQMKRLGELVKRGYHHRIVVATAAPDWQDAQEALLEGALDYIDIARVINVPGLRRKFKEEILPTLKALKRRYLA